MRAIALAILVLLTVSLPVRAQKAPVPDDASRRALPKNLKAREQVPLIVFLHGKRNSPDDVLALLKPLVEPWRYGVLAPCGSVAMGPRPDGTPGYDWKPEADVEAIGGEIRRMLAGGSVDAKRVYLAGFSAGAHLCYAVLAKHPDLFAGVICFGGAIQKTLVAEEDLKAAARTPVFIVHGERDRVIPFRFAEQARDALAKAAFRVQLKTFPGDHQMPPNYFDVLKEAVEWCDAQKATLACETLPQAVARLRSELPPTYAVQTFGRLAVASNCGADVVGNVAGDLLKLEKTCLAMTGRAEPRVPQPVSVYYFATREEFRQTYRKIMGVEPPSLAGCCSWSPVRLFGSADVGDGTLRHELVHVVVMDDWPDMPGWLNESLAVTLGCPKVGIGDGTHQVSDVWLFAAQRSLKDGKWAPLRETLSHSEIAYAELDRTMVDVFPGMQVGIGPLNTGRMLVRWLAETGKLAAFYRKCRDSKDPEAALKAAAPKDIDGVEKELVQWVNGHDAAGLLKKLK